MNAPVRATIADVAERAGVSKSAVSKVLRNAYGISDALRASVEQAMADLNYRPQIAARGLRGRTYTIGVVMPDIRNPFFPDIIDGIWDGLQGTQYQPLFAVRHAADETEKPLLEMMLDRKLDGFVMIAPIVGHDYLWQLAAQIPTVVIGRHEAGGTFDTVNNDDDAGARRVVEHLARQGHRRIAFCGFEAVEDAGFNPVVFRTQGYRAAMRALGLEPQVHAHRAWNTTQPEEALRLARELLTSEQRPTAVFAWTDQLALHLMSVAGELGLRIPQDLAVVGYDNSRVCTLAQIQLSSVDQDAELLGSTAAELLVERIEGRTGKIAFVTRPELVARRSSSFELATD